MTSVRRSPLAAFVLVGALQCFSEGPRSLHRHQGIHVCRRAGDIDFHPALPYSEPFEGDEILHAWRVQGEPGDRDEAANYRYPEGHGSESRRGEAGRRGDLNFGYLFCARARGGWL